MNNRAKGLLSCREVRKLLEAQGYLVEGPGYKIQWMPTGYIPCHKDYFDAFDLITYRKGEMMGHQVTDLKNKAARVKKIEGLGLTGWVWARTKVKNRVVYRVFNGDMEITI